MNNMANTPPANRKPLTRERAFDLTARRAICMAALLKTSIAVLNHRIEGLLTGCQSEIPCPAPCPWPMRMKYAEMKSPNNEVITARNTHKAMRAGGTPTSPTSPERLLAWTLDPWRSHDRVLKRLTRNNQTITPTRSAPNATQIFMNALCRPNVRARPAPTCRAERFAE